MSDKLDILKMIEAGQISVEEGLKLLEAVEQTEKIEDERYTEEVEDRFVEDTKERFEGKDTKSLNINVVSCRVNIEKSNVDDVTIELRETHTRELVSKPDWLVIEENEDTIIIKENRMNGLADFINMFKSNESNLNLFVNVKLPLDMMVVKGNINSVSGTLSLIGLSAIDLSVKTVSGKVTISDTKATTLQAKTVSGALILDNIKTAKALYNTTSGKIKVSGSHDQIDAKSVSGSIVMDDNGQVRRINASTTSGKVDIQLIEPESFNLELNSITGKIDTSGFAVVNSDLSGKKSVKISNRSEDKWITASTLSGRILIDQK